MSDVISKIESVKSNVMSDSTVQTAWETLHTRMNNHGYNQRISVDERTMGSRDMVKELTEMNLNSQNAPNITDGTCLHFQKMSNLCVYFATMSAVRHEMKEILRNSTSTGININIIGYPTDTGAIPIPAGKSIDEIFEEKEFQFEDHYGRIEKFQNALSFEIMLSLVLGCVSPRPLSGLVKPLTIQFKNIIFLLILKTNTNI